MKNSTVLSEKDFGFYLGRIPQYTVFVFANMSNATGQIPRYPSVLKEVKGLMLRDNLDFKKLPENQQEILKDTVREVFYGIKEGM